MSDTLNGILVECCKLRGCYPLMHRTLHQFDWFVEAVIYGPDPGLNTEIAEAEQAGNEALAKLLRARQTEENALVKQFKDVSFDYDKGNELITLARAFRVYCTKQYGPIQTFSPDYDSEVSA
jgi:hypothetical protein